MRLHPVSALTSRLSVLAAAILGGLVLTASVRAADRQTILVQAPGFTLENEIVVAAGTNTLVWGRDRSQPESLPFTQAAVKQGIEPARLGPDPSRPYFTVRFALPIPPENATNNVGALAGLDPRVFTHNHSPGFEILPNGDALAIYFSTPPGKSENDPATSFIQARLRYGAEEWDPPELFFKTENYNDQSGLLWNDRGTLRFFGGGRDVSDWVPFKQAVSTNNGATWTLALPQLDQPAENYTAQPITSAFRGADGSLYFAMDGDKATSFLWRSPDEGIHWRQMAGRTSGRHSVIVPLDDRGNLLSIGGKNNAVNGWSPENVSTNYGAIWSAGTASPFPPLGSAQRPSLIRLADGNLFFVSDAYLHKADRQPPDGWAFGNGCFVALSTNRGATWRIKPLPVQLPNHQRGTNGTLGYVTARQAPNGVIHVLSTETQPCLHYELNEAWVVSDAGDVPAENSGGAVRKYSESYPSGKIRSRWSARICPNGRYLLDGRETDFYENGAKQHEATYAGGCLTGDENFWSPEGSKIWSWTRDLKKHTAVWTQYWPNGRKKVQSAWNTRPQARDLARSFSGLVADGPVYRWDENGRPMPGVRFANGILAGDDSGGKAAGNHP
jgi:hypothetical protein